MGLIRVPNWGNSDSTLVDTDYIVSVVQLYDKRTALTMSTGEVIEVALSLGDLQRYIATASPSNRKLA